jgi:hypothetical protein
MGLYESDGFVLKATLSAVYDQDGWSLTAGSNLSVLSQKGKISNVSGFVEDVDPTVKTIDINGINVIVPDSAVITIDGVQISGLAALKEFVQLNQDAVILTLVNSETIQLTLNGWEFTDSSIALSTRGAYLTSFKGAVDEIDDVNMTITIAGQVIKLSDTITFTVNGSAVNNLAELKDTLAQMKALGTIMWCGNAMMTLTNTGYVLSNTSDVLKPLNSMTRSGFTGYVDSVDRGRHLSIKGVVIHVPAGVAYLSMQ